MTSSLCTSFVLSVALMHPSSPQQTQESLDKEIDALIAFFSDPEAPSQKIEVTQKVIARLAEIGKPAVPKLIDAMIKKDDYPAAYSGSALIKIGAAAVEQVRARWPQLDEVQKWRLMRFRGKLDYEASLEFALASLESKDADIRHQAIKYAGQYKEAKARKQLLKMLNTEVPERHRWIVIENLAEIGSNHEAAEAVIALLASDSWAAKGNGRTPPMGFWPRSWPDGRDAVILALEKLQAKTAAPKLLEVLQEKEPNKGYYFSIPIADLLAQWSYKEAIPDLRRLLATEVEWVSPTHIARALLRLQDRTGVAILSEQLSSKDANLRVFACKAFAMHGDKSDVLLLGNCLNDEDNRVRFQACQGLERITGVVIRVPGQTILTNGAVQLWKDWLEKNKGKLAAHAAATQTQESLDKEIDALIAFFSDLEAPSQKIEVTQKVIARLAEIGKPAVPKLIDAVIKKDDTPAAYSGSALIQIGAAAVDQVRARWPQLNEVQKWRLMRFCGKVDYEASVEFALASLESKDPDIRHDAIKYVGQYKEAKARKQLLKMLNTEVPERHRWEVIESLAEIGNNDEVADALIALLATDSWAAKGDGLAYPGELPPWGLDGRERVVIALGKLEARKSAPKLLEVLREQEPNKGYFFNIVIAELFGDWSYAEAIPDLKRFLLAKTEWSPSVYAARGLLRLKDRSGIPLLLEQLKSKHRSEREFACKAFAEYGDRSDVILLGNCLNDEEGSIQLQACMGLERITGLSNRLPGQTILTLGDVPLWKAWFEQNKGKYGSRK